MIRNNRHFVPPSAPFLYLSISLSLSLYPISPSPSLYLSISLYLPISHSKFRNSNPNLPGKTLSPEDQASRLYFTTKQAKVRFKRLDLRFLEIQALRVVFTKRDPEFPGISGQVV
eukprot:sb/3476711/